VVVYLQEVPGLSLSRDSFLYQIHGSDSTGSKMSSYIASTPETRAVCSDPGVLGSRFMDNIQDAIQRVVEEGLVSQIKGYCSERNQADVLEIVRGGRCYDSRRGLESLGLNVTTHTLVCQRKQEESGEWVLNTSGAKVFSEERVDYKRDVNLFCGDIVATGTSLEGALRYTFEEVASKGYKLNSFNFFTIGGEKAEEVVQKLIGEYVHLLTDSFHANVVYLEGRFGIATTETPLVQKYPGTDLLVCHEDAIIAPEFAETLVMSPSSLLLPCVIQDGGARAFSPQKQQNEMRHHWSVLKERAGAGLTLHEAINERYPIVGVNTERDLRKIHPAWKELSSGKINEVLASRRSYLSVENSSNALIDICNEELLEVDRWY